MASKDRGLTPIELSGFCSEIALMLGAGMPLYAGMEALEKTYEQDAHADLYHKVSETLTQTGSLRDALEETHAFPTYLVEMCGIGERTGHLEDVMQGLSAYYERESRIRQAVRSAVTYPLVLSVMMVLILMVLILKVMPVFRRVLGSMGVAMTATGSMMMNVGTVIGWVVLVLVLVFALAALICVLLLKSGRREQVLAGLKKAFPPLRRLSMRLASSRAASVLAMMLSSGFPLEQALEMVPLVLPDAEAAGEIAKIREKMGEGVSFSDALTGSAMFDEIHRQMLRMGIAAGREDQVMSKIAQTYEQQVEESISGLVSIIEPTMVAALSIVIGAVLLDADGRHYFQHFVRAKGGASRENKKAWPCARPRAHAGGICRAFWRGCGGVSENRLILREYGGTAGARRRAPRCADLLCGGGRVSPVA